MTRNLRTEQVHFGRLPVASMTPPYNHTIGIGGAGKACRRLGGHIVGLKKKHSRGLNRHINLSHRSSFFPCRSIGKCLKGGNALCGVPVRVASRGCREARLHRGWADAKPLSSARL
jgi:hypothetical protein